MDREKEDALRRGRPRPPRFRRPPETDTVPTPLDSASALGFAGLAARLPFRRVLALVALAIALAGSVRFFTEPYRDPAHPGYVVAKPTRDDQDITIYIKRGAWAPTGLRPYLDVFSEYPPLATWIFGIPYAIARPEPAPPRAMAAALEAIPGNSPLALRYADLWCTLMAATWFAVAVFTALLAGDLGLPPARALLLLGPASLYCALQRFDALPALATSAALLAFVRGRSTTGFSLLALGVLLKIYPFVLAPLALGYVARRQGFRAASLGAAVFAGTIVALHVPTFLAGVGDPGWTAPWRPKQLAGLELDARPMRSGVAAVGVPFAYQGARDTNPGALAERLFRVWLGLPYETLLAGLKAFRLAQLLPALAALALGWLRPRPRTLVAGSAALVTLFVLFHNIFSPQFQCWIVPLVAVAGGGLLGAGALALLLGIDFVTYLQFPILAVQARFDPATQRNVYPAAFPVVIDVRLALMLALTAVLLLLALRRDPVGEKLA